MTNLEKFYHTINQSNALTFQYDYWKKYRNNRLESIKPFLSQNKNVIILGAGNCNDLALEEILESTKSVTLVDIDIDSVKKGIKKQNLLEKDFNLINLDLTGLSSVNFYSQFSKMLEENNSNEKIYQSLKTMVTEVNQKQLLNKKYDLVISTPVYSQLVYSKLFEMIDTSAKLHKGLKNEIIQLMPIIIRNYNDFMISILKNNGYIILWSDLITLNEEVKDNKELQSIYEKYKKTYGLGIPDYGIENLCEHLIVKDSFWDVWPFNKKINFLIKGIIGQVK